MHKLKALQHLIDDILFVNVFKDTCTDYSMKISIHEVKHQIDITIVLCTDNILKADDVLMPGELLQEYDLSECALGISCILKSVKIFLQRHDLFGLLVDCLPDDTIRSLAYIKEY